MGNACSGAQTVKVHFKVQEEAGRNAPVSGSTETRVRVDWRVGNDIIGIKPSGDTGARGTQVTRPDGKKHRKEKELQKHGGKDVGAGVGVTHTNIVNTGNVGHEVGNSSLPCTSASARGKKWNSQGDEQRHGEKFQFKTAAEKAKLKTATGVTPSSKHNRTHSCLDVPHSNLEVKTKLDQNTDVTFVSQGYSTKPRKPVLGFKDSSTVCSCMSCIAGGEAVISSMRAKSAWSNNELGVVEQDSSLQERIFGLRRSKSDLFHTPCYDYSWLKLTGEVDDCNCKVESVSSFNNLRVNPSIRSLVSTDYFRFFKVNLNKPCPFWPDDGACAIRACAVCPCTDDQVPCGLKDKADGKHKYADKVNAEEVKKEAQEDEDEENCESRSEEEIRLSALDTTISKESKAAFETWREHDDAQFNFCQVDDELSTNMEYVDLTLNPERYTGYKGPSPHRIWNSIYNENCFKPDPNTTGYQTLLTNKSVNKGSLYLQGLCLEKRVFYRLISGLHTSINVHLCADYLLAEDLYTGEVWGANVEEFKRRFDPVTTDGEGPTRLKNLYFTYLVVLRAIAKAAPLLKQEAFYTGNEESDKEVKQAVLELLKVIDSFNNHFNESQMFQGNPIEASQLKEEFRSHFWNISRIMDCVGCDKCKLWGKLQIQGLGTALKILFTDKKHSLRLNRQEIVPLIVGFSKLSYSIAQVEIFQELIAKEASRPSANRKPKANPFV